MYYCGLFCTTSRLGRQSKPAAAGSDNHFNQGNVITGMLQELVERPGDRSAADLHEAYLAALREVVDTVGIEDVAESSGVEVDRIGALVDGETVDLSLEEAAGILAAAEDAPADALAAEARDHLLMGMTSAVLDVDTVAANLEGMSATGIQQRIEGRSGMSLEEFATLHAFIASRQR